MEKKCLVFIGFSGFLYAMTTYAAPDPSEQLAEAAGAYYSSLHQLVSAKSSTCGYAFDFDASAMLMNGEQDILRNIPTKYHKEFGSSKFQSMVRQESINLVAETSNGLIKKFGTQSGCLKFRNLFVNEYNAFQQKWEIAKKNMR